MFQKSYEFIKDVQADRMRSLYENLKYAKKIQDQERVDEIKKLVNEEKQFVAKQRENDKDRIAKKKLKQENVQRAA